MKRFLRSTAGKTVTFIICILCFFIFVTSVIGAVIMAKSEMYTKPEQELEQEIIDSQIREMAWELAGEYGFYSFYTVEEETTTSSDTAGETIAPSEMEEETTSALEPGAIELEAQKRSSAFSLKTSSSDLSEKEEPSEEEQTTAREAEPAFIYGINVPDKGNVIFCITDPDGKVITASEHAGEIQEWEYSYPYVWITDENGYYYYSFADQYPVVTGNVKAILQISLKEGLPEEDSLRLLTRLLHHVYSMRYAIFVIGGLALILMIVCFIILMCVSARRPDTEELHPGPFNRVPFDLLLAVSIAGGLLLAFFVSRAFDYNSFWGIRIWDLLIIPLLTVYMSMLTGLSMSFAARIKQKNLLHNMVIFYILKGICYLAKAFWKGLGKLPLIWKTVLAVLGIAVLDWVFMAIAGYWVNRNYIFLNLVEKIVLIPVILYIAWCMRRLFKSGEALARGNLAYQTDTKGLFWDFRKHGENLNRIADGMKAAVNESVKSERMKTELITNVSHDIKTPLTSIINYAGLIGNEPCENEKIKEYSEVLVRQSERLKRLIEDLVEASKASTGNLEVELVPSSANMFLSQASGEYEEKLAATQLELVVNHPEQEIRIMADGRRMWRIFDNLMNNICKYALPGSRVYLSLEQTGKNAVFTFRNTSREALNISEEELMERFTRGDSSRHTEGNGLGLSIAKSLAQLQNGELRILIDGDLFKAQLCFPVIS